MTQGGEHTVKAFDEDIGELRALVSEMGGIAETAIGDAMHALTKHDLETAERVVKNDFKLNELEARCERLAVRLIALRAPMADDLREAVAAMKIANVLERIGDYAKNIAKRVHNFERRGEIEPLSILPAMAQVVSEMVHDVLDAFAARDAHCMSADGQQVAQVQGRLKLRVLREERALGDIALPRPDHARSMT